MAIPRRSVIRLRPLAAGGLAVIKVTETDADGWESPAWYAVRRAADTPGVDWPHRYALARLGSRRLYCVTLGATPGASTCECLGSGGDGSKTCRHIGALFALAKAGQL